MKLRQKQIEWDDHKTQQRTRRSAEGKERRNRSGIKERSNEMSKKKKVLDEYRYIELERNIIKEI